MKIIPQSFEILYFPKDALQLIELAGRTCYKSEDKITPESASKFVRTIMRSGHHSVIEHESATVRFITNRGFTHELVRHRLASYSQESSRYCNYGGKDIVFIQPVWWDASTDMAKLTFTTACEQAENCYQGLLKNGWRPEQAREVLPNALKTEIVTTANLREWPHIFKLRTSSKAHPQIREAMTALQAEFVLRLPEIFGPENGDS